MANQRVMPDWMYEAGPYARDFVNSLNKVMTNPGSTGISPNDLIINQTPLGSIRDMESIYNNGLNKLPPAFLNAMGSGTGRAVSYGLAGMAGLGALMPMMNRLNGVHPVLARPPPVSDFETAAPSAFRPQAGAPDMPVDNYSLPRMLQQQAGNAGGYAKPSGRMKEIKTEQQLIDAISNGDGQFIRWSRGPTLDKKRGGSRDFVAGSEHGGFSAVQIEPEWALDPARMTRRVKEYGFLRMKDSEISPYLYSGEKVGVDSDGYDLITGIAGKAKISTKLLDELSKKYGQ